MSSRPFLTPWEQATGVAEAALPGLLPARHTRRLTWALALVLAVLLWPAWGMAGVVMALVFARLMALDLTIYTLPNIYTIPLLAVGLLVALGDHLLATLLVWLALWLVGAAGRRWPRQGLVLGEGDLKLLAALVACLGPLPALAALAVGCLLWLPAAWLAPSRPLPLGVPLLLGWAVALAYPALPSVLFSPITL
ncbi:MAG: prepilin peptidase [Alphaproteobacteria bacterium]|jgi:prepilin signal peptidase PulO-like enzyme (type II secretory pathway)|nr:prepilin peptidase [Alphaproteobacteria bacterium]